MYAQTLATHVARTTAQIARQDWLALLFKEAQTDEEKARAKSMADMWLRVVEELDWRVKRKGINKNRMASKPGQAMVVADALIRTASEIAERVDNGPAPTIKDLLIHVSETDMDTLIDKIRV